MARLNVSGLPSFVVEGPLFTIDQVGWDLMHGLTCTVKPTTNYYKLRAQILSASCLCRARRLATNILPRPR